MNPKSVKCCMTTNIKKKTSKLARKRQTSSKQKGEKVRRFKWTDEDMEAAIGTVISGNINQREAAQKYSVPQATLQKIIKGKTFIDAKPAKKPCLELSYRTN